MISIYDDRTILIYYGILMFILGTVLGSFLNCFAWRISNGEKIMKGRSHCTSCGHTLGVLDLIPIISWLALKGKCRYCKAKIPPRYIATEVFFGFVSLVMLLKWDISLVLLRNYIAACIFFLIAMVDLESMEIPNACVTALLINYVVFVPFIGVDGEGFFAKDFMIRLAAGIAFPGILLVIALIMEKVLGKESLGGGDIKLFSAVGLYLGFIGGMFGLILACIFGLIFAKAFKEKEGEGYFPFGPSICLAVWLIQTFGQPLINFYSGLL